MYDIENIYEAVDIQDAIKALVENPSAIPLAGGTDILIKIREGKLAGKSFVSLHHIDSLKGITQDEQGNIMIRPLTTFSHITYHPLIKTYLPMLGEAVDQVGGPQIRNMGTIGGNICNGVTSADSASTLFTYNALLEITGPTGIRNIPITAFYKGPGRVHLQQGELLTGICITKENYEGFHGHYIKYAMREAMDIATLGCAVNCKLNTSLNQLEDVRLAFGVAGPTPMRCNKAESAVIGQTISPSLFKAFSEVALTEVNPRTSWRASRDFRLQLVKELSKRALKQAILLGGGHLDD